MQFLHFSLAAFYTGAAFNTLPLFPKPHPCRRYAENRIFRVSPAPCACAVELRTRLCMMPRPHFFSVAPAAARRLERVLVIIGIASYPEPRAAQLNFYAVHL